MDKVLGAILLILFVVLIMTPAILWINYRFNDDQKEIDDLSEVNLIKLEIKKDLLSLLNIWIKENNLSHEQIANKLAVNLKVISDIVHQRSDKLTIDHLIDMVLKTGRTPKLVISSNNQ